MKILITCYKLNLSGSSTYTLTLCDGLIKSGNEIYVLSFFADELAQEFKKIGVKIIDDLNGIPENFFDIIIAQHSVLSLLARYYLPGVPMIFISHGILPELEQIPSLDINIQNFVAISEECHDHIRSLGLPPEKIQVIRNFIDIEKFVSIKPINPRPMSLLYLSNHDSIDVQNTISSACQKLNINYRHIGKNNQSADIVNEINKADIVISLGRGILEAMSCGRAALVYDYNGGDGMVTADNISEIKKNNFSGRRYKINFDVNGLLEEIKKYDQNMSGTNRNLIENEFNSSRQIENIEKLCQSAINAWEPKAAFVPGKELAWCCREMIKLAGENTALKNRKFYKIINTFNNLRSKIFKSVGH